MLLIQATAYEDIILCMQPKTIEVAYVINGEKKQNYTSLDDGGEAKRRARARTHTQTIEQQKNIKN